MEWATGIAYINPFHKYPFSIYYMCHSILLELINIFQIPRFQNYYDCFSIEIETYS